MCKGCPETLQLKPYPSSKNCFQEEVENPWPDKNSGKLQLKLHPYTEPNLFKDRKNFTQRRVALPPLMYFRLQRL